jgi:enoyl-CoA hydratase/carnithine racemase
MAVHAAGESDIRALVVRADGPNFCMGGDLSEWPGKNKHWFRTYISEVNAAFRAIEALRVPTIAVIQGMTMGGGFELALSCDFIVAAEDASFICVEVTAGMIPLAGGLQRLAERLGRSRAVQMVLNLKFWALNHSNRRKQEH